MKTEKIFTLSATNLKKALHSELMANGYEKSILHNKSKFLYAEGNAPYMLVAHLDTVHKQLPSIICYSKDNDYIMSPQGIGGDDRCGVYIILELLKKLPFRPYIVFTMDEEIGGVGAKAFKNYILKVENKPTLKYIVEYDRKGDRDAVFYDCDNTEFVEFVEKFGFKEAYGSYSDISTIAPALKVAAVNLSSGYYNPHTEYEYVSTKDMKDIIQMSLQMFAAECESFEYIEKEYYYAHNSKYREVSVSFLPPRSVYVCPRYGNYQYMNSDFEVAVDKFGNYYRYSEAYGDLITIHGEVTPIGDEEIAYNADEAVTLSVYF